jgi:hypothetical protein
VVRNGVATHGGDLRDDLFGRRRGVAGTVECSTEVVDDDLGALVGEQKRVLAPDAATGSGDDCYATV